jgi:hypothetical protein
LTGVQATQQPALPPGLRMEQGPLPSPPPCYDKPGMYVNANCRLMKQVSPQALMETIRLQDTSLTLGDRGRFRLGLPSRAGRRSGRQHLDPVEALRSVERVGYRSGPTASRHIGREIAPHGVGKVRLELHAVGCAGQ